MPKGSTSRLVVAATAFAGLAAGACTGRPPQSPGGPTTTVPGPTLPDPGGTVTTTPIGMTPSTTSPPIPEPSDPGAGHPIFDAGRVHSIAIAYDQAAYDAMIATFRESGDKEWISATVTIDGSTYENVGIRLKGNSSLSGLRGSGTGGGGLAGGRTLPEGLTPPEGGGQPGGNGGPGAGATAETPEKLPWLVKFNEFVEGQKHEGRREIVVRSNSTQTALNEALSLELLARTGLAYHLSAHYELTVNGERKALRLVTDSLEEEFDEENFDEPGILYKAEAGGDYSYRGHDPAAYDEIFDQETGEDNLVPLMDFLQFINQSSDADFAAQLPSRLDVQAFADYLAFEDLINNWDDIEGPGNNSYLRWTETSNSFTIVAWDHNLAFSSGGGGFAGGGVPGGGVSPLTTPTTTPGTTAGTTPTTTPGATTPLPPGGGSPRTRANALVTRFKAVPEFMALYDAALVRLRADLFASGAAEQILDRRAAVILSEAADLVPAATVDQEVQQIAAQLTAG